jgi:Porin subfamily
VFAYTLQWGGGWSSTISAENSRRTQLVNANGAILTSPSFLLSPANGNLGGGGFTVPGTTNNTVGAYGGWNVPDVVGNIRVDGTWGSAQVMGALHQVNANYYLGSNEIAPTGNPSDEWGWAAGAGIKWNFPFIGTGDYLQAQIGYTQGALRYFNMTEGTGNYYMERNGTVGWGVLADGVYGGTVAGNNTTGINLTTAWAFNGSYEHFWTPDWKTSVYGWYEKVEYNDQANSLLCAAYGQATGGIGAGSIAKAGCDNNFNFWGVGTRTQWNVTKSFYMGVDVAYGKIESATSATGLPVVNASGTGCTIGNINCHVGNTDNWTARFRVHKDFYP